MKRVSEINETIKFNNTKIGGMKEIMVKAHALARLIRLPNEPYARAFRNALKSVWRKIRRADSMNKRVYIYFVNGSYAFAETRMDISVASDYFCMIDSVDRRCESAVDDVLKYDFCYGEIKTKKEKRLVLLRYINAWLPQLRAVENYNANVGYEEHTIENELTYFINNEYCKRTCSTLKDALIQFIYEYGYQTRSRIRNYVSSYSKK